jgi:hypothetical protein
MSHELRTPLTAIIGYSEIVKDELSGINAPPGTLKDLDKILDSSSHLLKLIYLCLNRWIHPWRANKAERVWGWRSPSAFAKC